MTADMAPGAWSTSQLVEFLAVLADQVDEAGTLRASVERVLETLDAEVGVLFDSGNTLTVVGLDPADPRVDTLIAASRDDVTLVDLPGLGRCRVAVVWLEVAADSPQLLVARVGADDFVPEEMLLLRGMAWVLHLALRPLRVLVSLKERQRVLEQVSLIQRAIANRAPLPAVFETVTEAALELFGSELAVLYLAEQGILLVTSVSAVSARYRPPEWRHELDTSIARAAFLSGTLVRADDYPRSTFANPHLVRLGAQAAMAAPVRENGVVVGCLVAVSFRPGHVYSDVQEQTMLTFADQISTAMSDAKTVATAAHAVLDMVTGLPNRVFFLDRLERAIASGIEVHVLFLDLDRFKYVNDTLGHIAGDDLLREVGARLRTCLRGDDCLARFGGDEFAVLVDSGQAGDALRLGQRLLVAVRSPYLLDGDEVSVGASIGIATCRKGESSAADVLRDADTAMYRAKHTGGNRIVVFEPDMHAALVRRASLEADLRHALGREELTLAYQPICELSDGRIRAAEALVRWQHPERGTIAPSEFIPLAEETGLIVAIGGHILMRACEQASTWPRRGDGQPPLGVSVNVSPRQLLDPHLVADVRHALDATGLEPSRLILEITESAFVSDEESVLTRLRQMRDLGVRLAIDDFGTGYSSLSYLRRLPVDILKIDHSFVEEVAEGWRSREFLRTIVKLTETFSLTAVCEGVETYEQLSVLRRIGCQLGQGYLLARPMTPTELRSRLEKRPTVPLVMV